MFVDSIEHSAKNREVQFNTPHDYFDHKHNNSCPPFMRFGFNFKWSIMLWPSPTTSYTSCRLRDQQRKCRSQGILPVGARDGYTREWNRVIKQNQLHPGFELGSPIPFLIRITVTHVQKRIDRCTTRLLDFNGKSTHHGILYALRLGNPGHCTFMFTFFV